MKDSEHQDDLVLMALQIQLNQLATISLKRKRTAALLKLG
jgi:hypothetical protein